MQNLDHMDFEGLEAIRCGVSDHPRTYALKLFPEKPKGYVRASRLLALYACELLAAQRYRLAGHGEDALGAENRCQLIYDKLPSYAKW